MSASSPPLVDPPQLAADTASAAPATRVARLAEGVLVAALLLNLLDLLSSFDRELGRQVFPQRTPQELWLQLACLVPLAIWLAVRSGAIWRRLSRLPIPAVPKWIVAIVLAVELGHLGLRREIFPFSHVGMFSHLAWASEEMIVPDIYVVRHPDGRVEPVSILREGDPVFSRYMYLRRHQSWVLYCHRGADFVRDRLAAGLRAHGLPAPQLSVIRYRTSDGTILDVQPKPHPR